MNDFVTLLRATIGGYVLAGGLVLLAVALLCVPRGTEGASAVLDLSGGSQKADQSLSTVEPTTLEASFVSPVDQVALDVPSDLSARGPSGRVFYGAAQYGSLFPLAWHAQSQGPIQVPR